MGENSFTSTVNSISLIPLFIEQEFLPPQDSKSSSMSPTRRSCRTVIEPNPLDTIPKKMSSKMQRAGP